MLGDGPFEPAARVRAPTVLYGYLALLMSSAAGRRLAANDPGRGGSGSLRYCLWLRGQDLNL
jgi:hypothetical protein